MVKWLMAEPENAILTHENCEVKVQMFGSSYFLGRTININGNARIKSWKVNDKTGDFIITFVW
jgi:hypothetical protein